MEALLARRVSSRVSETVEPCVGCPGEGGCAWLEGPPNVLNLLSVLSSSVEVRRARGPRQPASSSGSVQFLHVSHSLLRQL
jgi:hypothetical protein